MQEGTAMPATETTRPTSEIAILSRVLSNGETGMSPELARHVLGLDFSNADKARMHDLAARNQEGVLSPAEKEELVAYANAGCLLGILHSKARKSLKKAGRSRAS
jgi:hypothetical protein